MNQEKQRIAITEACGWIKFFEPLGTEEGIGHWEWHKGAQNLRRPPDYLNDLTAMHEAEKVLTVEQRIIYAKQLGVVLSGGSIGRAIPDWWFIHEATASNRAEAFLKTLGLWTT